MIEELKNKYNVKKEELIDSTKNYISKKTYRFTLNDGTERICDQIIKKGMNGDAVVIIPMLEDNNICMIFESRPLTKEGVVLEFPAGMIDENENPKEAALRELKEETGLVPNEIKEIEWHYQDQGCSKAIIRTYLATNCKYVGKQLEEYEKIESTIVTEDELKELVFAGKDLVDANTKIASLTYLLKR